MSDRLSIQITRGLACFFCGVGVSSVVLAYRPPVVIRESQPAPAIVEPIKPAVEKGESLPPVGTNQTRLVD